jgi:putative nucleotidyltransferase with HDIG domain
MSVPPEGTEQGPVRIMVVDDDADIRATLGRILRSQHHDVLEAAGAVEALATLERAGRVQLVISDIHMPGHDGIWLLQELRRQHPDVGVLMLTGDADVATAVECLTHGAMDYLSKPMLVGEVQARVDQALEQRRLSHEVLRLRERYQADLERQVLELSRKNEASFLAQVHMAVRMLEAKDSYTRGHSERVADYAVVTARRLGLGATELEEVRLGGALHDIGKIGTRDEVLNKAGPLTPAERAEIERHTLDGEEMLSVLRADHPRVLEIVRWHHERMDGSGFPDRLRGDQIPMCARIVAVVDAFDAMTSTRAYRDRETSQWAFDELRRCSGSHFDDQVVEAFIKAVPDPDHQSMHL